jgi:hypothetical protein
MEAKQNAMNCPMAQGTIASIRGNHKLIHYFGYPGYENEYEFYDLKSDPEELKNLYSSRNPIAAEMQNRLQQRLQEVNQPYL